MKLIAAFVATAITASSFVQAVPLPALRNALLEHSDAAAAPEALVLGRSTNADDVSVIVARWPTFASAEALALAKTENTNRIIEGVEQIRKDYDHILPSRVEMAHWNEWEGKAKGAIELKKKFETLSDGMERWMLEQQYKNEWDPLPRHPGRSQALLDLWVKEAEETAKAAKPKKMRTLKQKLFGKSSH